jgi:hypothetical protein
VCTASPYSLANAGDFVWLIGNGGQFPRLNSWAYNETEIWNDPVIQWSEDERFVQCTAQDAIPTNTEFAATIPLSSGNTSADAYHISNVTFIGNDDEFRASVGTINYARLTAPNVVAYATSNYDARTSLRINKNRHPIRVRAWSWTDHQHYLQGVTDEIRSSNISIGARGWINKF